MPESSLALQLAWQSALLPLIVALGLLAAFRALRLDGIAAVVAVATAFLASYFATLHSQWSLLPHRALDWLPWIAVGAAAGALATEGVARPAARFVLRAVIGMVAAGVVAEGAVASLGAGRIAFAVLATGLLIAAVWTSLAPVANHGARRPLLLAMVAGGTGLSLMLDSTQQVGQLSGALATALGACMLFNLPRSRVSFPPAAVGSATVLLGALILTAHLYASFSIGYVALLLVALLADPVLHAAARLRGRVLHPSSWIPAAVLTALPVVATVALVVRTAHAHGGY